MIFDTSTFQEEKFSWKTALYLAHASQQAYQDDPEAVKSDLAIAVPDAEKVTVFQERTTEGLVIELRDFVIISYRGTKGRADWINNFKTKQIRSWFQYPGKIHTGFHEALNHVWKEIIDPVLEEAELSGKKIYLAGHSLGGALCVLTAARIARKYHQGIVGGIYTFGQPKTGNQSFANYMDDHYGDCYHRFVYNRDIVARIPPKGYRHCGKLYHFDSEGQLQNTTRSGGFESFTGEDELTEEEFERFQIQMLKEDVRADLGATRGSDFEAIPSAAQAIGAEDHSLIYKYLPAVRAMAEQEENNT